MDNLTSLLEATLDPRQRRSAEKQLSQVRSIAGMAPALLQIVMSDKVAMPVRQGGVIYLKNMILSGWNEKEAQEKRPSFNIQEQDRTIIRDSIVEAIIQAPQAIKVHLCVALIIILRKDFPTKWTQIIDKLNMYLQDPDANKWMGAVLCMYQLIKSFEFTVEEKKTPLIEAMRLLLPIVYNIMANLQADQSEQSILMQKLIIKSFYTLVQFGLPMKLLSCEVFSSWMEILRRLLDHQLPEQYLQVDVEDRPKLLWWKVKKWAIRTLHRIFERYGSPMNCRKEYVKFAEWYLRTFTEGILAVLLRILDQYRNKVYVTPVVLNLTLSYIDLCVGPAHSWKMLKPHMVAIIQEVIFPLMCHTDGDEELWDTDPQEYIRVKFDIFEDHITAVTSAEALLITCCAKRKHMLDRTMQLCMQILNQVDCGPRDKDGVLHMLGTVNEILSKKNVYKDQIETVLCRYVFPEFSSPFRHLRARACWLIHNYSDVTFKQEENVHRACSLVVTALLTESELPVKVEAAIALQTLLFSQELAYKILQPQIAIITRELLKIFRDTESDNLATVLQRIVPVYTDELMPLAVEITESLAATFMKVISSDCGGEETAMTAMSLLNTMNTTLNVMEDNPQILAQLEKIVLPVVVYILQNEGFDYFEEVMSLLCNLSNRSISSDMWSVLELTHQLYEEEGVYYFTDMMPVLHNYVTVDTNAFLANENRILAVFNMCKLVLMAANEDESELYAAKLLEVMVLQCSGRIDSCLPSFVELVLNRLTGNVKTSELRTMLLQVPIAILYYNPNLLFSILAKLQESVPTTSITDQFIKQWIHDTDCFMGLHDRKLCILGICTLLEMGQNRPSIDEVVPSLLPSCLMLFEGLKGAYEARAELNEDTSSEEDDDYDENEEVLSTDEDDVKDSSSESLARTTRLTEDGEVTGDPEDDSDNEDVETAVECFTTPLDDNSCTVDEYIKFKNTLTALSTSEPILYAALTNCLSEQQKCKLKQVFTLADQRRAQQESKWIEQNGGYGFIVPAKIPSKFNFSP